MITIAAISDQHGELPNIPKCHLLLIGGDICPEGSPASQARWMNTSLRHWLKEVPADEIVAIAGNHDVIFEHAEFLIPQDLRWHYLKDDLITLFGITIYGSPWQLPFWGAFNADDRMLESKYAAIPKDIDILITHGPPFGILDEVPAWTDYQDERPIIHTGSISLRKKIFEVKPKLVVSGHIHCAYGFRKIDEILFANASLLNDDMELVNKPFLFNWDVDVIALSQFW